MHLRFIVIIFFLSNGFINAQKIEKYTGDMIVDKEKKSLKADFNIQFNNLIENDTIKLFIHESAKIQKLTNNNNEVEFIVTDEKLIGEDKAILIPVTDFSEDKITISYTTDLGAIKNPNFKFNPNWLEFNIYIAWFPFNIKYGIFDYEVNIKTAGYVIGTDVKGNTAKSISKTFDIPLIILDNPEKEKVNNSRITLYHNNISDTIIARIKSKSEKFHKAYSTMFGKAKTQDLSIAINNFSRSIVYARPQFISLSIKDTFTKSNDKTLAHEIGHLWWNKAGVGTWEDWLNESFAEYSALLSYKKEFGTEDFNLKIESLAEKVENLKPIWGINKLDPSSNTILTYKGAYLLCKLEEKIGEKVMIELMKKMHQAEINSTSEFLNLLQKECGKSVMEWMKSQLKK